MKIIVGSTNPVKIKSVILGFQKLWPNLESTVVGQLVDSTVSHQPMSATESIQGARTRAQAALASGVETDYGVGLEGGLEVVNGVWFDCGWCVIVNSQGLEGIASSARIETPESIMKYIHQGKELGDVIDIIFNKTNAKQAEGQFGLMTNGAVTRTDGYVQAVCLALSRFLHPELF